MVQWYFNSGSEIKTGSYLGAAKDSVWWRVWSALFKLADRITHPESVRWLYIEFNMSIRIKWTILFKHVQTIHSEMERLWKTRKFCLSWSTLIIKCKSKAATNLSLKAGGPSIAWCCDGQCMKASNAHDIDHRGCRGKSSPYRTAYNNINNWLKQESK
jgi:hypothetical protein